MTNVKLNQTKNQLYIALNPHLEDAEATEKAIAEFAQEHGIPQEEVQRMADEQTAYREKEKARQKKAAEDKAQAERMATIVRTFTLDTRKDLQSVRDQKMKAFAKAHGIGLAALKADVKAFEKEFDGSDQEDKSGHQANASKLKMPPRGTVAADDATSGKPVIDANPGDLHIVIRQAEKALLDADVPVFQRVGVLVRPAVLPTEVKVAETAIAAGSLVIEPVSKAWLAERMNEVAT